jgi:hypothetical protein
MRITSVVMYSGDTELASFALGLGETADRYLIKAMSGIDADGITPRFYSMGLESGTGLFDFGLPPRELVFRIGLNPKFLLDETFSELRDRLYRAISANRNGTIRIQFNSGASVVSQIYGFIIKFEASLFVKSPEAQLTVRCDDPFFRAVAPVTFTGLEDTDIAPIVIPDSISTAPHGFQMSITFSGSADSITVQPTLLAPEWVFTVTPSGGFVADDILVFSSEHRSKYAYVDSGGPTVPVIDGISLGSVWPVIFPGLNTFYLSEAPSVATVDIVYYPAYWGV